MRIHAFLALLLCTAFPDRTWAEDGEAPSHPNETRRAPWRIDGGLHLSRFEQQVKPVIGGVRGERLVESTELGLAVFGTRDVWRFLSAGVFLQLDAGSRSSARFDGFDAEGAATTADRTGGSFRELWLGPVVRAHWRRLFAEVGWGPLALRGDTARADLPAEGGDTTGLLATTPRVSWLAAVGGDVPMATTVHLVIRLEYRVRYYTTRGGRPLDGVVHGTQNFTTFVGVAWIPGGAGADR